MTLTPLKRGIISLAALAVAATAPAITASAATLNDLIIWVPDYYGQSVLYDKLSYATTPPTFSHTSIDVSSKNCNPNSVTINKGLLYVVCNSDFGGIDQVLVYDSTTRHYKKTITGAGTDGGSYFSGGSLIGSLFDAHGNLWVTGYNSNTLLRIPHQQLGAASPLVDREVIDSPDSPAGLALDADKSIWIVGQFSGGILLNFTDAVLNQSGTFLGGNPLNPNPRYCISSSIDGCDPVPGLFDNPEGVAVFDGNIWVSNNGGNAPTGTIARLIKHTGDTLTSYIYGGTVGKPFSCPGGMFTLTLPDTTTALWVNDEGYGVKGTDCGASSGDQGASIGRVLEFTPADLLDHRTAPKPEEFTDWTKIHTGSPGFGGIFVQAD
jgi:hypothetical protein